MRLRSHWLRPNSFLQIASSIKAAQHWLAIAIEKVVIEFRSRPFLLSADVSSDILCQIIIRE